MWISGVYIGVHLFWESTKHLPAKPGSSSPRCMGLSCTRKLPVMLIALTLHLYLCDLMSFSMVLIRVSSAYQYGNQTVEENIEKTSKNGPAAGALRRRSCQQTGVQVPKRSAQSPGSDGRVPILVQTLGWQI